jgi:L-seryl-tRNA(Ser) seleniumtransferase
MQLAAAACLTGVDKDRIARLPNTAGLKNEFIISKVDPHFYVHQGIEMVGGKLVWVGTTERVTTQDIVGGIGPRTAAVVHFLGRQTKEQLREVLRETLKAGVPTIVDAAAQLPPRSNLTEIVEMGADLVAFSGGKGIRGPQCTGLVVGRKEKVEAVRLNSSPWSAIGRGMKVGKEEIMGLVAAVEMFLAKDEAEELREWDRMASLIVESMSGLRGIKASVKNKGQEAAPDVAPRAYIDLDGSYKKTKYQVIEELKSGDPSIVVRESRTGILVDPMTLKDGEEKIVARRLREVLS